MENRDDYINLKEKYNVLASDAKDVIAAILKKHKDEYSSVYEMFVNEKTKDSILTMILDYYVGGAKTYFQSIKHVETYYKRIDFTD